MTPRPAASRVPPRPGRPPARLRVAGALLLGVALACITQGPPEWGANVPRDELERAFAPLPPEASSSLLPLSELFYGRIISRRFDSRATFEDPSVRQLFPSVEAYSDYYAALVDALARAYIENSRPWSVELLGLETNKSGSLRLRLRFVGDNDLPLRWWTASLDRDDEWEWREGRWWVVPGKI